MKSFFILAFLFNSVIAYGVNCSSGNFEAVRINNGAKNSTNERQQEPPFNKGVLGKWCFSPNKTEDFSLSLELKNDSVYCLYEYVKHNGSFLNAEDGDSDWAFVVPKYMLMDTYQGLIAVKNYHGLPSALDAVVHVFLKYDKQTKSLTWSMKENTTFLPKKIKLKKCTKWGV